MGEISQADLIREDIETKISENYDFSKTSFKQQAVNAFIKKNPELNTDFDKAKKSYYKILKEFEKQKGLQVASNKKRLLKPNPEMLNNDMETTINPVPQISNQPQLLQPQIVEQQQINPKNKGNHDEKAVSAALTAFYLVLRTGFAPEAELLSDDEKTSLGKLGKPIFDRFFGENEELIVCFLGIGGVFVPKLAKGRKIKKEKTSKEKQKEKFDGFDS